jgi:hypothetical protein
LTFVRLVSWPRLIPVILLLAVVGNQANSAGPSAAAFP